MPDADPQEELATLVSALRAHLELCAASGATGFVEGASTASPDTPSDPRNAVSPPASAPAARPAPAAASRPSASPRNADEARVRLEILAKEASACSRCGLHAGRKQAVFARGTGSSGLCFVGEGPGADEDEQGSPFVGKAGQLLDKMIEAMGLGRDEVYVCNIVKCRPPQNRKPEPDEMSACRPYLTEQIALIDPKVIVALGATAVEGLIGASGGITRLRGNWRLYRGKIAVMPTFHPAYLLRTPEAKREVWQDLQEVLRHMGRSVPARK
ncbi:MAG TPA: uracil-DNA glycosylase [Polyangiaceae bacterium]